MRRFAAKVLFVSLVIAMSLRGVLRGQVSSELPYYPMGWGVRIDDPNKRIDITVSPGRNYYTLPPTSRRDPGRGCQWGVTNWPIHKIAGQDMFTAYIVRVKGLGQVVPMPPCQSTWRPVDVFRLIGYVFAGGPKPDIADVTGDGVVDGRDVRRLQSCVYAAGEGTTTVSVSGGKLYGDDAIAHFNPDTFPKNGYARIIAVRVPFGPCDGPPPISYSVTVSDVLNGKGFEAGDWLAVEFNAALYSSDTEHPIFWSGGQTMAPVVWNWYWNY